MSTQEQRAATFQALHADDPFVIPNPWDAGSARVLAALGFKALATTSSGFAFTLGRLDGGVTLDEVVEHTRLLDRATSLPVSVDLENGYGPEPEQAALAITRAAGAGAVGGSIEDYDPGGEIYGLDHAAERVAAACEAARRLGFPFTLARLDGNVTLDEVVRHVATVVDATDLPVSVDLENGYGPEPENAALAVSRVAEAGAVGGSIEDWDPDGIYALDHAVERVAAAVEAARGLGWPFTLTARAENHIRGNPDLEDTIARLQAFEAAGADVLYAPGLETSAEIRAVCDAVSKPVNVLARPGLTFAEIADAGARRVSVGGSLTWTVVNALVAAATEIRDLGDFSSLGDSSGVHKWLA